MVADVWFYDSMCSGQVQNLRMCSVLEVSHCLGR